MHRVTTSLLQTLLLALLELSDDRQMLSHEVFGKLLIRTVCGEWRELANVGLGFKIGLGSTICKNHLVSVLGLALLKSAVQSVKP